MKKQGYILIVILLMFQTITTNILANNIRLESAVKVTEVTGDVATLEFSLKWDNAWRDSYNWDAIWVFLKYKSPGNFWMPVELQATGHTFSALDGKSHTFLSGISGNKTAGLFILLNEPANCNPSLTCRLKWTLPTGVTKASFENNDAFLLAQGIEMVYIPYGAYQLGDTSLNQAFESVLIDSEDARTVATTNSETIDLAEDYPKGYRGFHVMKYETSQEQYVAFLNTLTLTQQQDLVPNYASLKPGDYIFGDSRQPSHRNGIILVQKPEGAPMIFDNNLTPDEEYGQENDGKYLPCNYMSIQALQAYCAWAGLRPMSELEFEKCCRRPLPDLPSANEYVWGNTTFPTCASGIRNENTPRELPAAGQVNATGLIDGPIRCGSFSANTPGQHNSGATYWGVMELAGNLREICATAGNATLQASVHGAGDYTLSRMRSSATTFGYRGGSFKSPVETLQTSDRSEINAITSLNTPDSTAGFRAIRTFPTDGIPGIGIQPGTIALGGGGTTVCPGEEIVINSTAPATVSGIDNLPISYIWYVDGVARTETGETLRLSGLSNSGTAPEDHSIKRKAVCMLGEAETSTITVSVLPSPDFTLSSETASIDISGTTTAVTATASVTGVTLTFNWKYQGNTIATGTTYTPDASHFGNTPGIYTVTCEATSGTCSSAPVRKDITVRYVTQSAGTIALADGVSSICPEGKTITINSTAPASVSSGATIAYSWKIDGTIISGQTQETLNYTIPQNSGNSAVSYSFVRVATTSEGVKETSPINMSIKPWPNFTISPASASFATTGPRITATSSTTNTLSYTWEYNNSIVGNNNTYTPSASTFGKTDGSYTIVCTSSLSGCTATATQNLAITLNTCGEKYTDPRDNQVYPTVKVGNQCWMAKNLNVGTFTPIIITGSDTSPDSYTFDEPGIQKWCIGGSGNNISTSNEANCNTYGGLYEWWEVICGGDCGGKITPAEAQSTPLSSESELAAYGAKMVPGSSIQIQGICPDGWHVPSDAEWTTLAKAVTNWTIQLGGCRYSNGDSFYNLGNNGYWWSSTPNSSNNAYRRLLNSSAKVNTPFDRLNVYRSCGFSVRCIRND